MPPVMALNTCRTPVPATTRAVNVEALNSCSAYRISEVCIARTQLSAAAGHAMQQMQEMASDAGRRRSPPRCACRYASPVIPDTAASSRCEAIRRIGNVAGSREHCGRRLLRQHAAKGMETPVRITSIAMRRRRQGFERRRAPKPGTPRIALQLAPCRQQARRCWGSFSCTRQISNLLETRSSPPHLQNIVAPIMPDRCRCARRCKVPCCRPQRPKVQRIS